MDEFEISNDCKFKCSFCPQKIVEKFNLELIPRWRIKQAQKYKFKNDYYNCLASFILLSNILEFIPKKFKYNEFGKPFLIENQNLFFSISHTKNACAVAVSTKNSIGLDIEFASGNIPKFIDSYFSKNEINYINSTPNNSKKFYELWTIKEAIMKQNGMAFTLKDIKHIDTLNAKQYIHQKFVKDYAICIAHQNIDLVF
jgi:phosphopantetheinyl transferase